MTTTLTKDYLNAGPTILDPEAVTNLLDELLAEIKTTHASKHIVADVILGMLDRFSDSYARPRPDQLKTVFQWTKDHWQTEPIEYLDIVCSILATIANFGMDGVEEFITQVTAAATGSARNMLVELIEEMQA